MDKEIRTVSKYQTFCNLCNRVIRAGEECTTFENTDKWGKTHTRMFMIHLDCKDPEVRTRITNAEFRKNVKNNKKNGKRKTAPTLRSGGSSDKSSSRIKKNEDDKNEVL